MKRKKLLIKIMIPAAVLLIVSLTILIFSEPYNERYNKRKQTKMNAHLDTVITNGQAFLKQIADKLTARGINDEDINYLQSEISREHQYGNKAKKYLWLINTDENKLLFGVPEAAFNKLDMAYTRYQDIIKKDNHYKSRNDFFLKLIDKYQDIDFSAFESSKPPIVDSYYYERRNINWRFYDAERNRRFFWEPKTILLSTYYLNESGERKGTLYLKIDDSVHRDLYYIGSGYNRGIYTVLFPLSVFLMVLTAVTLWFLLPTWVYLDARQREVANPGLWAFLSLITVIFGWIIYMITRPTEMKVMTCPGCDRELNNGSRYCPHCGFDLSTLVCPQCQYAIKPEWSFCPNCRKELGTEEEQVAIEGTTE